MPGLVIFWSGKQFFILCFLFTNDEIADWRKPLLKAARK